MVCWFKGAMSKTSQIAKDLKLQLFAYVTEINSRNYEMFPHQCDQTWPNSANVADFGVCAAGKIWRWPAWPVGSFVAGSRFRGFLSKNRPFSGEKS